MNMTSSDEYELAMCGAAAAAVVAAQVIFDEEAESENQKRKRKRSCWVKESKIRPDEDGYSRLLENELKFEDKIAFRNFIGIDKKIFETLIKTVESELSRQDTRMRKAFTAREKLAATLRFLTTGESYKKLELETRMSMAFLSNEIPKICDILYKKLKGTHFRIPSPRAGWDKIASGFQMRSNFPLCIGALGCKHIPFRARKEDGAYFLNFKGFHSIILMALVDANCRFTYINVGCNGRISDKEVLLQSNLMEIVEHVAKKFQLEKTLGNGRLLPYVIVADSTFPLHKHVMMPYPRKVLEEKKIVFNQRLSRARHTVDRAFEILASRFRILQTTINLDPPKVDSIVKACCALYNFLLDAKETEMLAAVASTSTNQPSTSGVKINEFVNEDSRKWRDIKLMNSSYGLVTERRSPETGTSGDVTSQRPSPVSGSSGNKEEGEEYEDEDEEEVEEEEDDDDDSEETLNNEKRNAIQIRDEFAEYFSNEGKL